MSSRGVLLFEDFCRSTGLDQATAENLMRTELLDASLWEGEELTHPLGIFDDALPSRQALTALRLPVRDDYNPEALRSCEADEADESVDDASGSTWSIRW